jgi:hypothetical protein
VGSSATGGGSRAASIKAEDEEKEEIYISLQSICNLHIWSRSLPSAYFSYSYVYVLWRKNKNKLFVVLPFF